MPFRKKKTLLDQAADYVDSVRPHVESAVEHARDAVGDFVDNTARPALEDAYAKAAPAVADAYSKAAPAVADAYAKAGPAISDAYDKAHDKAGPALADARDRATAAAGPAWAEAQKRAKPYLEDARGRAADGLDAARDYAETKRAEVTGQPTPAQKKRKSRLKKLALVAVIGGAAYAALKLRGGPSDTWQSSYTPPAPTTPSGPTAAPSASSEPAANKPPAPSAVPDPSAEGTNGPSSPTKPTDVEEPKAPSGPTPDVERPVADEDGPTS